MSACVHCGTPIPAADPDERFCCKGCEFVYDLIHEEGLDRFYSLRQDTPVRPVRSVPFETHDFSWLVAKAAECEGETEHGKGVEGDFSLDGISCIGCVWLVEKIYQRHPGAVEAAAHPVTGTLHLRWRCGALDLEGFARELASFGYTLGPAKRGGTATKSGALGARLGLCGAFMLNAMGFTLPSYLGMPESFEFSGLFRLVGLLTATLSMLVGGSYFIGRAWNAARLGELHIDLPIAIGLISAFAGSFAGWALGIHAMLYFDFVCTFVFLMLLGRYLQMEALERNRHRLQRARPVPDSVRSADGDGRLELADLGDGVRFEIDAGQSCPVAAVVQGDAAEFSLEWINGEAEPCLFPPGRMVPAGAILLGNSPVRLAAAERWEDSLLAKLVSSERPAVRVPALERLLKVYLLVVLVVGLAAFATWWRMESAAKALEVMVSVFVVSCPCALGLALPMADEIAGSLMERLGVFIRQPLLWPRLCKVKTVIFDKTGTLTLERPVLANPEVIASLPHEAKLALAWLTSGSLHPVSRSLLEALGREGQEMVRKIPSSGLGEEPGQGRWFSGADGEWSLGKPGWRSGLPAGGPSVHDAVLCHDGRTVARFVFNESLRADAVDAVGWLKSAGYRPVILSGDRPEKVGRVALALGVEPEDAMASVLPMEKGDLVRELDHRDTLYLGDGANDSLAFDAAWTTGTPVVDRSLLEAKADFYFLGKSLGFLPRLFEVARRRRAAVRSAFAFALCYNLVAIGICLKGGMSPLLAAILMPLSSMISLVIVIRGLRGRKFPTSKIDCRPTDGYGPAQKEVPRHDNDEPGFRPSVV